MCHKWLLLCWNMFFSVPTLLWVLIMNGSWILSNVFPVSVEMILWFLSFHLLMWCITLIDLWILNYLCICGINHTWLWYMILFIYCWIWFANIFEDFCVCIHQRYCSNFLFWVIPFSKFYQGNNSLVEWIWECSLLFIYWNCLWC